MWSGDFAFVSYIGDSRREDGRCGVDDFFVAVERQQNMSLFEVDFCALSPFFLGSFYSL